MQGVTTALVLFILACAAYPKLVKNRPQFNVAIALVVIIILLDAVVVMFTGGHTGAFARFIYVATDVLQAIAFLALILSAGGIELHELADDMFDTYQVLRHGDNSKTVIVPPTGETPKTQQDNTAQAAPPPSPPPAENDESIPLE